MRAMALAMLLPLSALARPEKTATILVRIDAEGNITQRLAASDRHSRLRHLGWIKALRPPGVCIRTALHNGRPAWVEWTAMGPVVWDSEGLWRYRQKFLGTGIVPLPRRRRE